MAVLVPDKRFARVTDIHPQTHLLDAGITCVLLDVDNTIRSREGRVVPDDVRGWLEDVRRAGVTACILSNSFHEDTESLAHELGVACVMRAMKPFPFAYVRAMELVGADKAHTACIGDQISTDILGAHAAGIQAFLVDPLADVDLAHMRVIRKIERRIARNVAYER